MNALAHALLRAMTPVASLLVATMCTPSAAAAANTWFKVDPHVHSSAVSGDSQQDLGLIADMGKRLGFDAMFVTDHTASHVKEIGGVISDHLVLDDDLVQWPAMLYNAAAPPGGTPAGGSGPGTGSAVLASSPVKTGSQSLHVAASSSQYTESFVWNKRGPSLHTGDVILKFSAYPTRIDAGSGMFVSVSIGGDETMNRRGPIGYSTLDEVAHPLKHNVLIWQLGTPRPSSSDPDARFVAHDLSYTLNQWNDYTINVSQAIRDEIPAADQPHDMNALTMVKLSAAARGGSVDGYFDAFKLDSSTDLTQGQEFVRRNQYIHHWDTPSFTLFPSQEVGYNRHAQRFYFPITDPSQFVLFKTGIGAIPDIQAAGYPAQLNHPGLPGGVTSAEAISNQDYGAELVEVSERGETGLNKDLMTDNWDAVLKQGVQVIGTWTSDSHRTDKMGPASYLNASGSSFDALMRALYEGRQYDAYADFAGRAIFNADGSSAPAAARYPIIVSPDAELARVRLKITGGIPAGSRLVWVSNGEPVDSEPVSGTSFDLQRSFPLSGAFTYVRAELRSADDLRIMQTEPLFFRPAPSVLPAGMTYAVTGVTTPSGAGYVNAAVRGITGSSWDGPSQTLQVTLTNPAGSLSELRIFTGAQSPLVVAIDGQPAAAAASAAAYDAASGSSWWYDVSTRELLVKARQGAGAATADVVVTFFDEPMALPPAPTGLITTYVGSRDIRLHWTGGGGTTAGYRVYRDGALVRDLPLGVNDYSDVGLAPGTRYRYAIEAYNVAQGRSAPTPEIERETDMIQLRTVEPVADTYVELAHPSSNYGHSGSIRTDRDEDGATQRTYLRFVVPALGTAPITGLTLRLFGNSVNQGQDVHPVASTSWSETTTTWDNRPAVSDLVVGTAVVSPAGAWVSAPLDPAAVSSQQTVSFALDARSTVSTNFASRDSANHPQLLIETQVPANRAPSIDDVSVSGPSAANISFTPVVDDLDGDGVTCALLTQPSHGTATVASDCSSGSYRSQSGYGGADSFTMRALDSTGALSSPATVSADVIRAPEAFDVSAAGVSDTDIAFAPAVLDPDGGGLTCELLTQPARGVATIASDCSSGSYRSDAGFGGGDDFNYRARTALGVQSGPAKVSVAVNRAPSAGDVTAAGLSGTDISFTPSTSDPDSDPVTCEVVAQPAHGTATIASDCSSGSYRSQLGYGGADDFSYRAVDSFQAVSAAATATIAVNRAPVAGDVGVAGLSGTDVAFTPSASDPDSDTLTCAIVAQPAHGTAAVASDCSTGGYRSASGYGGADGFSYRAVDSNGAPSGAAQVNVAVNRAPVASAAGIAGLSDTDIAFTPVVSDPDGDALTCAIAAPPAHGSATVAADCSSGSYRSESGYGGGDGFAYTATDSLGAASAPAAVTVSVANAVLFADSFETADLSRWTSSRNVSVVASTPHAGEFSLAADVTNGNAWTRRALGVAPSTTTTTLWLRIPSSSLATAFTVLKLRTATDQAIAGIAINVLRKLQLRNDITATTTTGSAPALTLDTWHKIDFTATTAGAGGSTLVRQDGVTVGIISASNVNLGAAPAGMVQLGELSTGKAFAAQWDDVTVTSP
jgi:hypothetical protein